MEQVGSKWHDASIRSTHPSNLQLWFRLRTEYSLTQARTLAAWAMEHPTQVGVANYNGCNDVHSSSQLSMSQRLRSKKAAAWSVVHALSSFSTVHPQ